MAKNCVFDRIVFSLLKVSVGAIVCAVSFLAEPAQASPCVTVRSSLNAPDGSLITNDGVIVKCGDQLYDRTPPPYNARPGELLIPSDGRAAQGYNIVFRGYSNTGYRLQDDAINGDVALSECCDLADKNIGDIRAVLPFEPMGVIKHRISGDSQVKYGFSDLKFLPSYGYLAKSLSRDSVVLGIDGIRFRSPKSLLYYLDRYKDDISKKYVEIVYFNRSDSILRRAFIPIITEKKALDEWRIIGSYNVGFEAYSYVNDPIFYTYRTEQRSNVAPVLMLFAAATLAVAISRSDIFQKYLERQDICNAKLERNLRTGGGLPVFNPC